MGRVGRRLAGRSSREHVFSKWISSSILLRLCIKGRHSTGRRIRSSEVHERISCRCSSLRDHRFWLSEHLNFCLSLWDRSGRSYWLSVEGVSGGRDWISCRRDCSSVIEVIDESINSSRSMLLFILELLSAKVEHALECCVFRDFLLGRRRRRSHSSSESESRTSRTRSSHAWSSSGEDAGIRGSE